MQTSQEGINFIMSKEGLRLTPYRDGNGYSIGYGHQIKPDELYLFAGITEQIANTLFAMDLLSSEKVVSNSIHVPITQNQFDSLVSFDFNTGNLDSSTLTGLINSGADSNVIRSWWTSHYITSAGNPSTALQERRKQEADMFYSDTHIFNQIAMVNTSNLLLAGLGIFALYQITK